MKMWALKLLLLGYTAASVSNRTEEPTSYYYGLEESERGLPACGVRQACSALLRREWAAPALVRLCRCARRLRCPDSARADRRAVELNNRAHFKFCEPITDWPQCRPGDIALTVNTSYDKMDPEELEEQHHQNIQLVPPNVTFICQCPEPNYWKLDGESANDTQKFRCSTLSDCGSGDFCGNFRSDLNSLYQSCLCPRHHICVHRGGLYYANITELLYRGRGRKAYCQRVSEEYSYEEYDH